MGVELCLVPVSFPGALTPNRVNMLRGVLQWFRNMEYKT